eukprot:m51a1_g279 hypothetical protein (250) ;mRNA; r:272127-273288
MSCRVQAQEAAAPWEAALESLQQRCATSSTTAAPATAAEEALPELAARYVSLLAKARFMAKLPPNGTEFRDAGPAENVPVDTPETTDSESALIATIATLHEQLAAEQRATERARARMAALAEASLRTTRPLMESSAVQTDAPADAPHSASSGSGSREPLDVWGAVGALDGVSVAARGEQEAAVTVRRSEGDTRVVDVRFRSNGAAVVDVLAVSVSPAPAEGTEAARVAASCRYAEDLARLLYLVRYGQL